MKAKILGSRRTVQGSNFTLLVGIFDEEQIYARPLPHNFNNFTGAASAIFPSNAGLLTGYGVTGQNVAGTNQLQFNLQPSDTNGILPTEYMDFELAWNEGSETLIVQCYGQLTVDGQLF